MATDEQGRILDEIEQCVSRGVARVFFIDAPGGTGKTFTLNNALDSLRLKGQPNLLLCYIVCMFIHFIALIYIYFKFSVSW